MAIWRQETYGTRCCVNCGFLGKRNPKFDEKCFPVSDKDRSFGRLHEHSSFEADYTFSTIPWCFVGKADFLKELDELNAQVHETDKMRKIIERDRKCPSWYPWRQFASPKEHFDESIMLALETRREEFEQKMEQARNEFDIKLDNTNRRDRKRTDRIMIILAIAAVIFAVLGVYAAIASLKPDHWLFNWLFNLFHIR